MQGESGLRPGSDRYSAVLASADLRPRHLIAPVFVSESRLPPSGSSSMPGVRVWSPGLVAGHVCSLVDAGISSIILFGIPKKRTADGSNASDLDGVVQNAVRAVRSVLGSSIEIMTDVCICQYCISGHCGVKTMDGPPQNTDKRRKRTAAVAEYAEIDNDATLDILAEIALSHAEAGADVVSPSSMMDGQVWAIARRLRENGLATRILSYSAKHASSLYAPFRSAAFAPNAGLLRAGLDKASYQVSYANSRQVMREIISDIGEGADMVMIKPALCYLDLVARAKEFATVPLVVQNVSGEYSMIKAAAEAGLVDEEEWKVFSLASMRRAGADRIISYFSEDIVQYLR